MNRLLSSMSWGSDFFFSIFESNTDIISTTYGRWNNGMVEKWSFAIWQFFEINRMETPVYAFITIIPIFYFCQKNGRILIFDIDNIRNKRFTL